MLYWGNYSDSGTAWECGYAYATGKPVIVLQLGESSNLMIHEGSHTNLLPARLQVLIWLRMMKENTLGFSAMFKERYLR